VIGHMADQKTRRALAMASKRHHHVSKNLHRRSLASANSEHIAYRKLAPKLHPGPRPRGGRTRRRHRGRRHTRKY
jgi:hypothetical protein